MFENSELIAIIAVQSVLRAKPHEPLAILKNAVHTPLGQAILHRQMIKGNFLLSTRRGETNESQDEHHDSSEHVVMQAQGVLNGSFTCAVTLNRASHGIPPVRMVQQSAKLSQMMDP
jgi:hypothetical protein